MNALLIGLLLTSLTQDVRPPLAPLDVFDLERAGDPQISPDGTSVAFVRLGFDIMTDRTTSEIWQVPVDAEGLLVDQDWSHGKGRARPIVQDLPGSRSPRWSPSGDRVAFTASSEGRSQIHVWWADTGQVVRLTRLTRSPGNLTWSPDGKWLAFSMFVEDPAESFVSPPKKPEGAQWAPAPKVITSLRYRSDGGGYIEQGHRQLFLVSAEGGTPRQITSGEYDHGGPYAWHPSGESLVLSANRREDVEQEPMDSDLYRVNVTTGELTALTDRYGPDQGPAISGDGKTIAWTGFDDTYQGYQNQRLYVMNLDGGEPRRLAAEFDRSPQGLSWAGNTLYAQWDDRGTSKVGTFPLDGGLPEVLAENVGGMSLGRPYSGGSYSVALDGTVAYTSGATDAMANVAVVQGAGPSQRTHLNEDLFAQRQLSPVEEIWTPSSHDGLGIQAWIAKPHGFDPSRKYPLILEIHGGPFANYGSRFAAEIQLYAAEGYVVVYANPRGSTGYGEAFGNAIHHAYPGYDYDDLMSVVDEVMGRGYVDEDRLYVTGGSGGGVLTAWIVGTTDRFRAAVVQKPVIHWTSFALTADAYNFFYKYWFPGFPWEHQEHYWQRSPLSRVGKVKTPTMLVTGEVDYRTPMSETEQYYQALKLLEVDTAMVRIPEASHGIAARPSHMLAKVAHVLAWFEKHGGVEKTPADASAFR